MSIAKIISLSILGLSCTSTIVASADLECKSLFNKEGRSISYFSCLQDQLSEAKLKAEISKAENDSSGELNPWSSGPSFNPNMISESIPSEPLFDLDDKPASINNLPLYIAYSASKLSKEAVIAYGKSEVRVTKGSILSGGWTIVDFNEYSLKISRKNETRTIPLMMANTGDEL